jgi:hypothetical protein
MRYFRPSTYLIWLFASWLLLPALAPAETSSRLSTRFLARGEQALLEIAISGVQPTSYPEIPAVTGVEIRPSGRGPQTQMLPGRTMEYVFEYLVSSYDIGDHVLPSFEVMAGGTKARTEPIGFTVFNPDDLKWSEAIAGDTRFRYASAFRVLDSKPFNGETIPVEIKVYVPRDLFVEDWGIPDFERDGLTAWRFQPSAMRGQVNLLGMPYVSVAYPSTLAPTRAGKVSIGPASVRLITTQVVMEGILRRVSNEVNIEVPKIELESQPLPEGAPEGFDNAIGTFGIDVTTSVTEVQEGDPIPLQIVVSGSGNLNTLRPPKPVESDGWKLYDAAAEQRGDERRELSGSVVFNQFMRSLELKSAVPAFRLVYFDPDKKTYETIRTEPIPLRMTAAAPPRMDSVSPPKPGALPVERMTDILGLLHPASATVAERSGYPQWLGHMIGGLLALTLIGRALWMRYGHVFHKNPEKIARLKALREVERSKGDDKGFLMSAGRFIESWLGGRESRELHEILAERDALCFQPDESAARLLDSKRRNAILRTLRRAAMLWLVAATVFLTPSARAEDRIARATEAYQSARYNEAIADWLNAAPYDELSPDLLYNIGNACYRAGSPGHAALYYRRALARDPGHQEARQNLRFIERKYGAISIHRPEYQYAITKLPLHVWQNMVWGGLWLCALALLVFPATHSGARLRVAAIAALVTGPLLAACGGLGWRYFPDDAEFSPLARQAVIVGEKAILHTDAARTSPEVIDAPPGSLCEVIRVSGRWAYVAFATKTRGWIPVSQIERIVPKTAPEPPTIPKPKASDKSA